MGWASHRRAGLRPRRDLRTPAGHRKVGLGNRRLQRERRQVRAPKQAECPPEQRLCWEEGRMVRVGGSVRALKCLCRRAGESPVLQVHKRKLGSLS